MLRYEDIEFTIQPHDGIPVRVATPRMMYRMKRDTIRDTDRGDAERKTWVVETLWKWDGGAPGTKG